jgi:hypothetical protein
MVALPPQALRWRRAASWFSGIRFENLERLVPQREVPFPAAAGRSAAQLQYLKRPARIVNFGMVNSAARNFYPPHFCVFFRDSGRILDS